MSERREPLLVHEDSAALREIRDAAERLRNERPYGDLSEPLAAWLNSEASHRHITNANLHQGNGGELRGFCSCSAAVARPNREVPAECGRLNHARAVARVINGGES